MPHTGGITSRKNITLTVQETVLNKFLKINLIFMSSKLLSWDFQILKQCMSLNLTSKFKTVVFSYLWTLEYTSWPKEGIFHKKSCPVISDFTPLPSYIYDSSSSKNTHTHTSAFKDFLNFHQKWNSSRLCLKSVMKASLSHTFVSPA